MRNYPNVTGKRIVAALIDIVVLAVVFGIMVWLFGDTETTRTTRIGDDFRGETTNKQFNLTGLPFVVYLVIVFAYYIGFELASRATPGKHVMGLRVTSMNAEPLSAGRIVLRNVLRVVDGLPFLYLVGLITIAVSKNHQRVGDMAAATVVSSVATQSAAQMESPSERII